MSEPMRKVGSVEDGKAPTDPGSGERLKDVRSSEWLEEGLIMHLEPDQFVAATNRPVPSAPLSRRAAAGLWALRIFVVLVSIMVIYTFVDRLH
jgi:hypothetical protein